MKVKHGVIMTGLSPAMLVALPVIDYVWHWEAGRDATITSALDGQHMPGSKHNSGEALDLRTYDLSEWQIGGISRALDVCLNRLDWGTAGWPKVYDPKVYDIVIEEDHIHVEYDPESLPVELMQRVP